MSILPFLALLTAAAPEARLTIAGVAAPEPDGAIPLSVEAGDLDGDGLADRGTLFLRCAGGGVEEAVFARVAAPREAGSGLATGKRTHVAPHVFEASGRRLSALRPSYDIKKVEGARFLSRKGYDYYQALSLEALADLCPAAAEASRRAARTRSNIQNN